MVDKFRKENAHRITSRVGQKFELDRQEWTTWQNFTMMYEEFAKELEYAKVATKLNEAEWHNRKGEVVSEDESYGCKVTHRVEYPEMILMMDEVGESTSQKGDGPIGGEKQVCEAGKVTKEIATTKTKRCVL